MLAMLTGFLIPVLRNQKMALAAHVTGVMNGLVLIVLGLA
jgi:hydroxylaminobenzene mutase